MKTENVGKSVAAIKRPTDTMQINMVVGGCKVKVNFPPKTEGTAIRDVKRMMLGGAVKT